MADAQSRRVVLLERYAVKPHHVEAWEPIFREQVALRESAGFTVERVFLEYDAEPKLTCILTPEPDGMTRDPIVTPLQQLTQLEQTTEHRELLGRLEPHVFHNRVVRPVRPWMMTRATPESVAGTQGDRIAIMRRYSIVTGWNGYEETGWDDFETIWRRIVPVREKYGFRCLFAVEDAYTDDFTWAFDFDGRWEDFGPAQRDYYHDPDRVELRKVFDHMADYSIHPARQLLLGEDAR